MLCEDEVHKVSYILAIVMAALATIVVIMLWLLASGIFGHLGKSISSYSLDDCVSCYQGGRTNRFILPMSVLLSQTWYYCVQYTKHHHIRPIVFTSMSFTKVGLFKHVIYP